MSPTIPVITITLTQLKWAIHRVRHEHGDKWEPMPGCGCDQWAQAVWDRMHGYADREQRDDEAETEFLKPIR